MPPLLELRNISKRFGQVLVAEDLTLTIPAGEFLGIVGPNGAGKTSLFGIASGDIAPDAGSVLLNGRDVTRLDSASRCRLGIGRTYQVPRLFEGMTVFENVLVGAQQGGHERGTASHELAIDALTTTRLLGDANRRGGSLGLLSRKRLEVARALATRPSLLLLDEVAGGLTDPEVAELVEIVRGIGERGVTVVWIEHVVRALVGTVDRLLCLAGGRIIGDGAPADVLASPRVREIYLGTEATAESLEEAGVGSGS
jgi:branched-chain amino acid transport system ATP-binding protein